MRQRRGHLRCAGRLQRRQQRRQLTAHGASWGWPLQLGTGAVALLALAALLTRRFRLARGLAIAQVMLMVGGLGLAQRPFLIVPDVTLADAAAPAATLRLLLIALALGSLILAPSLYYLMRVFKRP